MLDTHLDLLDTDIPTKYFVCLRNIFKTSSRHVFKITSRHNFKTSSGHVFKMKYYLAPDSALHSAPYSAPDSKI